MQSPMIGSPAMPSLASLALLGATPVASNLFAAPTPIPRPDNLAAVQPPAPAPAAASLPTTAPEPARAPDAASLQTTAPAATAASLPTTAPAAAAASLPSTAPAAFLPTNDGFGGACDKQTV
jgi:hypothetical protein